MSGLVLLATTFESANKKQQMQQYIVGAVHAVLVYGGAIQRIGSHVWTFGRAYSRLLAALVDLWKTFCCSDGRDPIWQETAIHNRVSLLLKLFNINKKISVCKTATEKCYKTQWLGHRSPNFETDVLWQWASKKETMKFKESKWQNWATYMRHFLHLYSWPLLRTETLKNTTVKLHLTRKFCCILTPATKNIAMIHSFFGLSSNRP